MGAVKVYDLMQRRALITRESASPIRNALISELVKRHQVMLDFSDIDAVTPSFIDEILGFIDDAAEEMKHGMDITAGPKNLRIVFLNAPTRLSAKFAAIGRAHGANMAEAGHGAWEITRPAQRPTPSAVRNQPA